MRDSSLYINFSRRRRTTVDHSSPPATILAPTLPSILQHIFVSLRTALAPVKLIITLTRNIARSDVTFKVRQQAEWYPSTQKQQITIKVLA